ncbi:flagellar FlbD family protein [Nocardioides flavescens]|uniref:Flagellar protein FlbD n=1 Tax=Nocardioides flavescens TaxID=2691959 RepID=A0A6L7EVC3_9ACTN|nr:flagellar FlbD family protein [Nocardioides flavescens]MXG87959.1 flagellar protein FlbD [Nocardioides flavescens]
MIRLTRLSGDEFVVNSDLIERIDQTPDSVVTLVDGTKYVVVEDIDTVVRAIRHHRAEIIAMSEQLRVSSHDRQPPPPPLASVTDLPAHAAYADQGGER